MSTPVVESPAGEALLGDEKTWSGRIFSDGWVDAPETIESTEPATGDVLGTAGAGNADGRREGGRVRRARAARVGRHPVHRARGRGAPRRRPDRAAPRGADRLARARVGLDPAEGRQRADRLEGPVRDGRGADLAPARPGAPLLRPGPHQRGPAHAGGRGRRDLPVELPGGAPGALGGPGARARQRRDPQVRSQHPDQRRRAHRPAVRGGRPSRGPPARDRRRRRGRARRSARTRTCG